MSTLCPYTAEWSKLNAKCAKRSSRREVDVGNRRETLLCRRNHTPPCCRAVLGAVCSPLSLFPCGPFSGLILSSTSGANGGRN